MNTSSGGLFFLQPRSHNKMWLFLSVHLVVWFRPNSTMNKSSATHCSSRYSQGVHNSAYDLCNTGMSKPTKTENKTTITDEIRRRPTQTDEHRRKPTNPRFSSVFIGFRWSSSGCVGFRRFSSVFVCTKTDANRHKPTKTKEHQAIVGFRRCSSESGNLRTRESKNWESGNLGSGNLGIWESGNWESGNLGIGNLRIWKSGN